MCFGCLCVGHMSKDCRKCPICRVCNYRHPTLLHFHPKAKQKSSTQANVGLELARGGAVVSVQSSGLTGAGKQDCTLFYFVCSGEIQKGTRDLGHVCISGSGEYRLVLYRATHEPAQSYGEEAGNPP